MNFSLSRLTAGWDVGCYLNFFKFWVCVAVGEGLFTYSSLVKPLIVYLVRLLRWRFWVLLVRSTSFLHAHILVYTATRNKPQSPALFIWSCSKWYQSHSNYPLGVACSFYRKCTRHIFTKRSFSAAAAFFHMRSITLKTKGHRCRVENIR